jgi:hypothetical protein
MCHLGLVRLLLWQGYIAPADGCLGINPLFKTEKSTWQGWFSTGKTTIAQQRSMPPASRHSRKCLRFFNTNGLSAIRQTPTSVRAVAAAPYTLCIRRSYSEDP